MRVVLDTNVLASMAVTPPGSKLSIILEFWLNELFTLYISDPILTELERTLTTDSYFLERLTETKIQTYLELIGSNSINLEITAQTDHEDLKRQAEKYINPPRRINPEDDLIIATALDAKAKYLVTGDKALARLGSYREIFIVSPTDFVEVLYRTYPHKKTLEVGKI